MQQIIFNLPLSISGFFLPHYMEELSLPMAGRLEPDVLQSPFQLNQKKLDFASLYALCHNSL